MVRALSATVVILGTMATAAVGEAQSALEHGKQVYTAQKCQTCHSIQGVGNKRGALDDVGARLSEDEIIKLSEYIAKNEMKDTVLLMKKRYDASAFVDFIESWARVSGFEYRHDISDRTHSFVIQHDMGKRWSVYIANVFKNAFSDVGTKWADFQSTDNTVTFNVEI